MGVLPPRMAQIYADRQSGMTLKAIGQKHGFGPERARQICLRAERYLRQDAERTALRKKHERSMARLKLALAYDLDGPKDALYLLYCAHVFANNIVVQRDG